MNIHGHRLKKLPQTALLLARHYQGWKTADMVDELARKFDDPDQLRNIQSLKFLWKICPMKRQLNTLTLMLSVDGSEIPLQFL